jgi:hypothetical protein
MTLSRSPICAHISSAALEEHLHSQMGPAVQRRRGGEGGCVSVLLQCAHRAKVCMHVPQCCQCTRAEPAILTALLYDAAGMLGIGALPNSFACPMFASPCHSIWGLAGNGARTPAPWRSFWRTIENAFIGNNDAVIVVPDAVGGFAAQSIFGNGAAARDSASGRMLHQEGSSHWLWQWLIGAFSLLQPRSKGTAAAALAGLRRSPTQAYRLLRWQGNAGGVDSAVGEMADSPGVCMFVHTHLRLRVSRTRPASTGTSFAITSRGGAYRYVTNSCDSNEDAHCMRCRFGREPCGGGASLAIGLHTQGGAGSRCAQVRNLSCPTHWPCSVTAIFAVMVAAPVNACILACLTCSHLFAYASCL